MRRTPSLLPAAFCAALIAPAAGALAQGRGNPVAPLPGYACSPLKGTPEQIRSGAAVPLYDKPDPQARRPLRTDAGRPMIAPYLVLTRQPRVVEHGLVAMKTYDGKDGWVPAAALLPPLPLPDAGESFDARRAKPHSVTSTCQPSVFADGSLGVG